MNAAETSEDDRLLLLASQQYESSDTTVELPVTSKSWYQPVSSRAINKLLKRPLKLEGTLNGLRRNGLCLEKLLRMRENKNSFVMGSSDENSWLCRFVWEVVKGAWN